MTTGFETDPLVVNDDAERALVIGNMLVGYIGAARSSDTEAMRIATEGLKKLGIPLPALTRSQFIEVVDSGEYPKGFPNRVFGHLRRRNDLYRSWIAASALRNNLLDGLFIDRDLIDMRVLKELNDTGIFKAHKVGNIGPKSSSLIADIVASVDNGNYFENVSSSDIIEPGQSET